MIDKHARAELRSSIFKHLDGIAVGATLYALFKAGVIDYLLDNSKSTLTDLTARFSANEGYLNVALRVLCSQGWLEQGIFDDESNVEFEITNLGVEAFQLANVYEEVVLFMPQAARMDDYLNNGFDAGTFSTLFHMFENYRNNWGLISDTNSEITTQISTHLEGILAAPLIVSLGRNGLFHNYFSVAPFHVQEFGRHHQELQSILNFFVDLDWLTCDDNIYNFTSRGLYLAKRASAYGVTVSYLPTFLRVNELIFGDAQVLWKAPPGTPEIHVNRSMNVWGSGGAHGTYFKKVDEIIIDIFNKPIEQQPKGFVDVGCGNGTLIEHIFDIIWKHTSRGKMLDEFPLFIVGTDFNEAALKATRQTLNSGDIWAKVIKGDIGDPDALAADLRTKYKMELGDLLNVRSFLDHNRVFQAPTSTSQEQFERSSTGAFSFRGRRLSNSEVMQSLVEHLERWAPYVSDFGLLVIELHTLDPAVTAANLGKVGVTAYDATHGYTDQYILESSCFLEAAGRAGLHAQPKYQTQYPNSDLTTISINLLRNN